MVQTIGYSGRCAPVDTSGAPDTSEYIVGYLMQERVRQFSEADRTHAMTSPTSLIDRYVLNAVRRASVEPMEDGYFFAEIPGIAGVWADGASESAACRELDAALRAWLELKIKHADRDIPEVAGINLNIL